MNGEKILIKPTVDFAFKKIFAGKGDRSKIILVDFLNAVLHLEGDEKIVEIVYLNPFNDKEYDKDKLSIMDIKIKNQRDELIDIEMQINNADNFRKRSLYYWSTMYRDTIEAGKAYYTLKKCIVISILDFNLFDETNQYHNKFRIKEVNEGFELLDDLEIHYIELPKFNSETNIENMTDLEEWITFLKDTGKEDKQDKVKNIAEKKEEIGMAWEIINELSADEYERELYKAREKALLDEQSKIKYQEYLMKKAVNEAVNKAEKRTEKKNNLLIARKALIEGLSVELINKLTGLDIEKIKEIEEEINH